MQCDRLLDELLDVCIRRLLWWWDVPSDLLERFAVRTQSLAHNRNELRVDLVLMFLIIPLEFVKFDKHDCLFRVEMATEVFSDVRNERDHHAERLRCQCYLVQLG